MDVVVALAVVLVLGTLVGHGVHWTLHQPWSGSLFRSHMTHHLRFYPPGDLRSDRYRSSGAASGWLTFTPIVAAAMLGVGGGLLLAGIGISIVVPVLALGGVVGWAHGFVHDAFHVRGHWLGRWLPGFARLQASHDVHHGRLNRNLGILTFAWDRVFGTYRATAQGRGR